ncbi:MAG: response regulator [Deltaproteobacteria bacterium]|nr:response regulator [Deltaproteobacteria bacterium]
MATGDELLVVDSAPAEREGMRQLFEGKGYVVTSVSTASEARALAQAKGFAVALVDLDVDEPHGGLGLLRDLGESAPETARVLLTNRASFEVAVEALRLGAVDVVLKTRAGLPDLVRAVERACAPPASSDLHDDILREVREVLDESFRIQISMAGEVFRDVSIAAERGFTPRILVVDPDQNSLRELGGMLGDRNWEVAIEMTGGSALDKASDHDFHVVAVRAELMDLPGSMVVKTIQASRAETIGFVYRAEGEPSCIDRYEHGRKQPPARPFRGMAQLLEAIDQEVHTLAGTQRDRQVIQAFRSAHADFFRRFAELKLRIDRLVE